MHRGAISNQGGLSEFLWNWGSLWQCYKQEVQTVCILSYVFGSKYDGLKRLSRQKLNCFVFRHDVQSHSIVNIVGHFGNFGQTQFNAFHYLTVMSFYLMMKREHTKYLSVLCSRLLFYTLVFRFEDTEATLIGISVIFIYFTHRSYFFKHRRVK